MRNLVLVAAAVALLGVAGVAVASTPGAAAAACYNDVSGVVRVDVDGTGCKPKETPIELGAPLRTHLVTADGDALAGAYGTAFAACATGEVVLGGGWISDSINPDVQPEMSAPVEMEGVQGWYVTLVNMVTAGPSVHFMASAICAAGTATGFPD